MVHEYTEDGYQFICMLHISEVNSLNFFLFYSGLADCETTSYFHGINKGQPREHETKLMTYLLHLYGTFRKICFRKIYLPNFLIGSITWSIQITQKTTSSSRIQKGSHLIIKGFQLLKQFQLLEISKIQPTVFLYYLYLHVEVYLLLR